MCGKKQVAGWWFICIYILENNNHNNLRNKQLGMSGKTHLEVGLPIIERQ